MREAPWSRLVRELKDTGYESPYLDRLRARLDPAEAVARLETEIVQEMAQALGRTEDKLDYALLRLELAARAIDAAPDELVRYERVREFNTLRQEAIEARRNLQIHREAIGIRRNRMLDDLYPIPPRR
ncbi:MAG: hypothetical protein FJ148_00360 [Deltaproteobacteria bacterium]|nr:hypothetical protein [Deltaproteobacteria bacterium]